MGGRPIETPLGMLYTSPNKKSSIYQRKLETQSLLSCLLKKRYLRDELYDALVDLILQKKRECKVIDTLVYEVHAGIRISMSISFLKSLGVSY